MLPPDLIAYDEQEKALHKQLMQRRNTIYAHSDSSSYSVRPLRLGDFDTAIFGAPSLRITAEEATMLRTMASKLLVAISARMEDMVHEASDALAKGKI
jgi:hypothetical protein